MRYLCLLRGINVSGKKKIVMKDLRLIMSNAGFEQVETYLQSGNVLFESTLKNKQIETKVKKLIQEFYGYKDVDVFVLKEEYLATVVAGIPDFDNDFDRSKLSMTFLKAKPNSALLALLDGDQYLPDRFVISSNVVYVYHPKGYGNTKINTNYFERKLKVRATTRNYRSVSTLLDKL